MNSVDTALVLEWTTDSPDATRRFGEMIAAACRGGEVFLLTGDLGTGKTCLTQGIARGLGIEGPVSSPTFVLHCQYHGRLELNHYDAYRLDGSDNVAGLGFDDLFGAPYGVAVVEWPEMLAGVSLKDYTDISIAVEGESTRRFTVKACGFRHGAWLRRLAATLGGAA